ncbi:MAG: nucleotidyltransferase family protein [Thermodesulfobacteriota bacterium]
MPGKANDGATKGIGKAEQGADSHRRKRRPHSPAVRPPLKSKTKDKTMTVMDTEDVLPKLKELKPIITARYTAKEIGLFGSFVQGRQDVSIDIDVLVEFEEGADLFDLIGLTLYLEEALQRGVDVVPKRVLRPELQKSVTREVIVL